MSQMCIQVEEIGARLFNSSLIFPTSTLSDDLVTHDLVSIVYLSNITYYWVRPDIYQIHIE